MANNKNEVSQREFARIINKSEGQVSHYKRDGRLVFNGRKVLVKESKERIKNTAELNGSVNEWHANKEKQEIEKLIQEERETFSDLKDNVSESQLDLDTRNPRELYENARALREKAAALQAAAEYDKFIGLMVSKEVVERILFERGRQFRDGLTASARRISPIIAGNDNITEIENILAEEFRHLLDNFAALPVIE